MNVTANSKERDGESVYEECPRVIKNEAKS